MFEMCGNVYVFEDMTAMGRDGFLDICFKMRFCVFGSILFIWIARLSDVCVVCDDALIAV